MASKDKQGRPKNSKTAVRLQQVDMSEIADSEPDAENRSLESRRDLQDLLDKQVAEFIARGGKLPRSARG